jgi:hypothetical protein
MENLVHTHFITIFPAQLKMFFSTQKREQNKKMLNYFLGEKWADNNKSSNQRRLKEEN